MIIMSILHNFGKKKKKKKTETCTLTGSCKTCGGVFELDSNLEADVAPIHWLNYSDSILDYRLRQ